MEREPFYHFEHPVITQMVSKFEQFKDEAENIYQNDFFLEWYSKQIYNFGWKVLGLRYEGRDFDHNLLSQFCPVMTSFFKEHESLIYSIAYSTLAPGSIIYPHFDRLYPHNVMRIHLGLSIPDGDCCLTVNGVAKKWKEGELLMFDDSYKHEAWNKADETRVVLLVDFHADKMLASVNLGN
jgi:aspartyl/asparaginyl beta-hydroxylase (cupin superfamily)